MAPAPFLEWRFSVADISQAWQGDELGTRIRQRFAQSGYRAVQRLACEVRDGRLMLRGRLPAYLIGQVTELVFDEVNQPEHDASWLGTHPLGRDM